MENLNKQIQKAISAFVDEEGNLCKGNRTYGDQWRLLIAMARKLEMLETCNCHQSERATSPFAVESGYLIFYCPDCQDEVCRLFLDEPNEHLVVRCACGTIASLIHVDSNEFGHCQETTEPKAKPNKHRLYQLSEKDRIEWQKARFSKGQERYKDAHLNRYNLVDVMEELLDAQNILALGIERITKNMKSNKDAWKYAAALFESNTLWNRINSAIEDIIELDQKLPDDVCTDEKGGSRIWWEASND